MRVAICSDIHGNKYAFNAIINEFHTLKIDKLLVLGDIVGYYYHAYNVLQKISNLNIETFIIKGNHEDILEKMLMGDAEYNSYITYKYGQSFNILINELSRQEINSLIHFPKSLEINIETLRILIVHENPWGTNEYIYPDAGEDVVSKFDNYQYDFIFYGHTHYPCIFIRNNKIIANPGSVGQNRMKGGIASWCILDTKNKMIQFQNTLYDISKLKEEVLKYDTNIKYNYQILMR